MSPVVNGRLASPAFLLAALLFGACGTKGTPAAPAASGQPAAPAGAKPTGKVITVQMISDDRGNRFEPAEVSAHRGDVIEFTVGVGVHNVHFLPDSNPGVANLPEASEMLQLPGQTFDVPVNFPAGQAYYFQCDPHAPLGMHGHLTVVGG